MPRQRPLAAVPLAAVALAAAALAAGTLAAAPVGAAPPPASHLRAAAPGHSASLLLAAAARALAGETRVHLEGVMSQVVSGVGVYVSVGIDAGARYGAISETIASAGRRLRFGALLTPQRAYCSGDPSALAAGCTVAPAQAATAAGRWLSFTPGSVGYRAVAAMVGFDHDTAGLLPAAGGAGFEVLGRAVLGGSPVVELRGPANPAAAFPAGTVETLALAADGAPLPVAVEMRKAGRVDASERFSRWGVPFTVRVPRSN